jgi:UDP-MurNAc hydroxylase
MKFQILSHAGLGIMSHGVCLVCDPWVVGSTYWRSWWNYPPVSHELIATLKPDFIYLTHVHWDHFQGVSLRKFGFSTPIIIPREPCGRMRRDLHAMGFAKVIELQHGESLALSGDFTITSYHFDLCLDSVLIVEAEGYTLFNANDAKVMGAPLRQILRRHPGIDFVFRSHSSANARACFELLDAPATAVDDPTRYARDFALFVCAVRARYAIPFASNHCHLHKETFHFNDLVTTPCMVADYFKTYHIDTPQIRIMVSGDSWSDTEGFVVAEHDYFENRQRHLDAYVERTKATLEALYAQEARATVTQPEVARYFAGVFRAMPALWRRLYRNNAVLYVLTAGETVYYFEVDFYCQEVRELTAYTDQSHPIQIHTAVAVLRHCMASGLFAHLPISKRVRYRVTTEKKYLLTLLNLFFDWYEYELLPLRRILNRYFVTAWLRRWRELYLYAQIVKDVVFRRGFDYARYLPARYPVTPEHEGPVTRKMC